MIMIMEIVDYQTLKKISKKKSCKFTGKKSITCSFCLITLKENEAIIILKQLLDVVAYLHSSGVCHRDISPRNILLSEDFSTLKLIDFGVSKHIGTEESYFQMISPTGVYDYRAPEMRKGVFNEKIDEWGCGQIFLEMLVGKHYSSSRQ